ncbi:MAG: type III restriction endonuclease subunit R [Gordonia sp.]|uniref:DEAD/DEAH box helicase n=1 Tax=Gordonia sp. (in: high G+C Gram-positive bacteria) TaxID=84139 RepID=UPI000C3832CD|nr:DEAD/DEAH box helicase family protein [Gordonia sp. (in: high G+C Gram-positive bacteria)]MAU84686.1 type III restriction endonuclease subunit R [Gordonia sp. (in: high G+C Gram-positive bacteria)]
MQMFAAEVLGVLRREGASSISEIAEELNRPAGEVEKTLVENDALFVVSDGQRPAKWTVALAEQVASLLQMDRPLRPWQVEALQTWIAHGRKGIVEAVTGAGKTVLGIAAMADARRRGIPVVVLVPDRQLVDQWVDAIEEAFPGFPVGKPDSSVVLNLAESFVVATVDGLHGKALTAFAGEALVLADEVQRFGVIDYRKGIMPFKHASERLGLTAASEWPDHQSESILKLFFGEAIVGCGYSRAIAEGILDPPLVATVGVSFTSAERDEYQLLSQRVDSAEKRLRDTGVDLSAGAYVAAREIDAGALAGEVGFLARAYLDAFDARRRVMSECQAKARALTALAPGLEEAARITVFTSSDQISNEVVQAIGRAGLIAEATRENDDTEAVLGRFRSGRTKVLATARLLDEGVPVPTSQVGVIEASAVSRAQMLQRMGRVVHPVDWGQPTALVVLYVNGTIEDPTIGDGAYYELLRGSAAEFADTDAADAASRIAAWLGEGEKERVVEEGRTPPTTDDEPVQVVVAERDKPALRDAVLDVIDEYAGVATWTELREVLPELEVHDLLMSGLNELTWMKIAGELVAAGGRESNSVAERIAALDTLSRTLSERGPRAQEQSEVVAALDHANLLTNLSTPRALELWKSLGGNITERVADENSGKAGPVRESENEQGAGTDATNSESKSGPTPNNLHTIAVRLFRAQVAEHGGTVLPAPGPQKNIVVVSDPSGIKRNVRIVGGQRGFWHGKKQDENPAADKAKYSVVVFVDVSDSPESFYVHSAQGYAAIVKGLVDDWASRNPGHPRVGSIELGKVQLARGKNQWGVLGLAAGSAQRHQTESEVVGTTPLDTKSPSTPTSHRTTPNKMPRRVTPPSKESLTTRPVRRPEPNAPTMHQSADGEIRVTLRFDGGTAVGYFDPESSQLRIDSAPGLGKGVEGRDFRNPATAAATVKSRAAGKTVFATGGEDWFVDEDADYDLAQFIRDS